MADPPEDRPDARPKARVVHCMTGRLRLKIPQKRGDHGFFAAVERMLSGWDSIRRVATNPLTGSLLVYFTEPEALFAENSLKNDLFRVAIEDLGDLLGEAAPAVPLVERAMQQMRGIDQVLRNGSGGGADIRTLAFLALLAAGLVQLMRGQVSAPAATLLWYAGAILRLWDDRPEVRPGVAPEAPRAQAQAGD